MRLYYRADTRSPKTIFCDGFQPKNNFLGLLGTSWWQHGIRQTGYPALLKTTATDAQMDNVVCLAKKLESTPLFPVCDQYHTDYDSEIYIYVMALPDAELPQDIDASQPIEVFDMEAYQVQELREIMNHSVNPAMAGYVLRGHEAFVKNVAVQNIICAVKCKRSDFALTAGLPVFTKAQDDTYKFVIDQERYFEIGHEVFLNSKYSQDAQYKDAALDELHRVKAKGLQPSTRIEDALDHCGIVYNKNQIHKSTYFWQEVTSLNFGVAFFSILESIYYAAIQLYKACVRQSVQKPLEIVETLPDSMQDTHRKKNLSFYGRYFTTVGVVTGQVDSMTAYAISHF